MIKKYTLFLLICAFSPSLKIESMDYSKALFAAGCLGFGGVTATLYGYAFKDQLIPAGPSDTQQKSLDDVSFNIKNMTSRKSSLLVTEQTQPAQSSSSGSGTAATATTATVAADTQTTLLTSEGLPAVQRLQQDRIRLQTAVDRQFKQKSAFNYVLDGTVLFGITSLAALVYAKMPSVSPWFGISGLVGAGIGGYLMEARNTELKEIGDIDVVGERLADDTTHVMTTKNTIFTRLAAVGLGYCGGALFAKAFELGLSLQ